MIQEQGKHIWTVKVPLEAGTYQYKFIVDGEWRIDPGNPEVVTTSMGARNSSTERFLVLNGNLPAAGLFLLRRFDCSNRTQ